MILPGHDTVIIEALAPVADTRGFVLEPLGPGDLPDQRNVHLVFTEPGHVRGNHYHQRGREVTVAFGPALFRYRDGDGATVRDVVIPPGLAYRFTIPAGIAHAFQNPGPGRMVLVGFNTEPHDPARPDVVRDVLIQPK
jgi:UDP-2-acetamido-2,6-beta-L-arabino-hexul-4-ose reductase